MADVFSKAKRSEIMGRVRSSGTSLEKAVEQAIHEEGLEYERDCRSLPGHPDFMVGEQAVVFVHGCFWHGHHCKRGDRPPKSNATYWREKIARNARRDRRSQRRLRALGYAVFTIWECQMRAGREPGRVIRAIKRRTAQAS